MAKFKKFLSSISLQYKLLALLVLLPTISILSYLALVMNLFESDKIAYVYDSSLSVSRSLSSQVRSNIISLNSDLNPIIEGYSRVENKFDDISQKLFNKKTSLLKIYVFKKENKKIKIATILSKKKELKTDKELFKKRKLITLAKDTFKKGLMINIADESKNLLWMGLDSSSANEKDTGYALVALFSSNELINQFKTSNLYHSYLIDNNGKAILRSGATHEDLQSETFDDWKFFQEIKNINIGSTKETISPKGHKWFVSYDSIQVGPYNVLSFVEKDKALKALEVLLQKSLLFFVSLISGSIILSFFSSRKLTGTLRNLILATKELSEGNYDIQVEIKSEDEVGILAKSFNQMATQITYFMTETAEKARMEGELKTAQLVQENLFPESYATIGPLEIAGHYQPASECGGDWWFYHEIGEDIYLWIGDATGHGAGAALITAAAKSAVTILSEFPEMSPSDALGFINKSISETGRGKVCMTFFVGAFNKTSGEFTYSIAGHEPPFLLKKAHGEISKSDLIPLNEVNGNRAGEDYNSSYTEFKIKLSPGDCILFYTDGIIDMENKSGKKWSERKFIKSTLKAVNDNMKLKNMTESIVTDLTEYREDAPLCDDITFFMCQYKDVA
jgi:sigma-B regulation protein RsbU (phosphoserine phosphatase)